MLSLEKAEGKVFPFCSSFLFPLLKTSVTCELKIGGDGFEQDSDKAVMGNMWCYLSSFWTLPVCLCPVVFLRQLLLKASHANQSWQVVFLVSGVDTRYLLWSPTSCITKGAGEFSICWQKDDRWHLLAQHSSSPTVVIPVDVLLGNEQLQIKILEIHCPVQWWSVHRHLCFKETLCSVVLCVLL